MSSCRLTGRHARSLASSQPVPWLAVMLRVRFEFAVNIPSMALSFVAFPALLSRFWCFPLPSFGIWWLTECPWSSRDGSEMGDKEDGAMARMKKPCTCEPSRWVKLQHRSLLKISQQETPPHAKRGCAWERRKTGCACIFRILTVRVLMTRWKIPFKDWSSAVIW